MILSGLVVAPQVAHAGGFMVPTTNTAGWGRSMAGGSLFPDDPSAAFNNPAAMAFIDKRIAQLTVNYADIDIKYNGNAYDYRGNPMTGGYPVDPATGGPSADALPTNDGGQAGFGAWLPTGFMVIPINDQLVFGLSQVVPMGMRSTWDPNWKGRDFAVDTKIETAGLSGSLSFKVNENFSLGAGVIIQRSSGFVSQNLDLYASGANSKPLKEMQFPAQVSSALMRVKVDNTSPGWFAGVVWKPTMRDSLGFAYHAKIRNKLKGHYNLYDHDGGLTKGAIKGGIPGLAYPGLDLRMGASASARLDIPAYASLDWVHQFNDRFSLGATATWTEWSSFEDLTLKSHGSTIVSIPYNYRNTWTLALGGDYRLTDQFTVRAGVAYDQTPTHNSTRDPRIPDGDRYFASLGAGYRFKSMPELSIDAAYSRQFVKEVPIKTVNQDRLGGGRLDGKATSKGQVFSLSMTYDF
ncbi:TPA: outer membrane protein transport protein [Pseudomonas aeruginosa]|nr:outer membrane protein transport protein [Pseudomonas aeruginosa]